MVRKQRKKWVPEKPKDNYDIPDGLGLGVHEERDPSGQLFIYLQLQPSFYIVLGKYSKSGPKYGWISRSDRNNPYYVADYTHAPVISGGTTKHEHLLLAIAKVHEIIEDFERRKK